MELGFRASETSRMTTVGEKKALPTFLPGLTAERTVLLKLFAAVIGPVAHAVEPVPYVKPNFSRLACTIQQIILLTKMGLAQEK